MGPFTVCEVGFIDGIIRVGFGFDFNVSCNGCAGGGKQPHFLRLPLLIACFPEEGPVPPPVERKVFRFGPSEVFVWVSSSRPSPQTREDGCIDAAKGTLADHVPMIVGPAPNLGVEFLNQIGSRHAKRGFDRGSDARQESFDVFLGGLSEQSPVRVTAHVLSEEIKAFLHVRDDRLRRRKFKPSFLQKLHNDGFNFSFQQFFRPAGNNEVVRITDEIHRGT